MKLNWWLFNLRGKITQLLLLKKSVNTIVDLNCFSWGEVKVWVKKEKSLNYVLNHIFGALVFKRVL
ncbi:hypothetical protein VK86_15330 [Moellerella wisconsensis]|nr:hypothetical protein VK86_15330 [Moellerella wisconsensis]